MEELKPCRCGRKARVQHIYDAYDDADFGYIVGCPTYTIFKTGHTESVTGIWKEECIKEWNRRAEQDGQCDIIKRVKQDV